MTCGVCGRQVEVSDSGQAMPCRCIVSRCQECGHSKQAHSWDASGCMVGACPCQSYVEEVTR